MVIVTKDGLWAVMGTQEKVDSFCRLTEGVAALAKEKHKTVTVRQFYRDVLGIRIGTPEEYLKHKDYELECFVNPDEYGWDEKGYRRLFRITRIKIKERL